MAGKGSGGYSGDHFQHNSVSLRLPTAHTSICFLSKTVSAIPGYHFRHSPLSLSKKATVFQAEIVRPCSLTGYPKVIFRICYTAFTKTSAFPQIFSECRDYAFPAPRATHGGGISTHIAVYVFWFMAITKMNNIRCW